MAVSELNIDRCAKLVARAIRDFELDLDGLSVLTEAATGAFVITPLIAALAGAHKVRALTRDSHYGSASEVTTLTNELAARWGVADRIEVLTARDDPGIAESEVVTNLGFVRPLDRSFLERLGASSAVALMFEPWEHREADIDLAACRELGIPVLGTNEDDPRLRTFGYLPGIAAKLLLQLDTEVFGSRLLLVSGGRFATEIEQGLARMGAEVELFSPPLPAGDVTFETAVSRADAMVVADHPASAPILGSDAGYTSRDLLEMNPGLALAHIAGAVDAGEIADSGIARAPERIAAAGSMSVTAGYLGPKPVVDLHAAGLRVGAALSRARRSGLGAPEAASSVLARLPLARGFDGNSETIA